MITLIFSSNKEKGRAILTQSGVTLFELLVAVLLLGMVSTMIYSVLNVGIGFAKKGEQHILAIEQEQGILALFHRQINSAWYDAKQRKIMISADDDMLRIFTHQPFIYKKAAGLVLAIYRYDAAEQAVYYTEKRDFYNVDYTEDYTPDFADMKFLVKAAKPLSWAYDPDTGGVTVTYGEKHYDFFPKCMPESPGI